jgi:hypothetical protein
VGEAGVVSEMKHHLDRSKWPSGRWDFESDDHVEWRDEVTGYACLIHRNSSGAWCGYVGLPPSHPFHGLDYSESALDELRCHGGLTYANKCNGRICHVPLPGESDDVWWLGFDCAHSDDESPAYDFTRYGTYREQWWVRDEVTRLARQIAEAVAS